MTKAAVFDENGREIGFARRPNEMQFPGPGHTERDPDRMWKAACESVTEVLEATATKPSDVAAVSVSGYGGGLYVVDKNGDPVRPGIVSTDSRTIPLLAELRASGALAKVSAQVQQHDWPGQSAMLMAWLARNEPEMSAAAASITFCKDFIRRRLTGDHTTDPTDAGLGGLMDVTTSRYANQVYDDLGMAVWRGKVPPIAPTIGIAGHITAAAARLTGLAEGTPVSRGIVDVAASTIASGIVDSTEISTVAGTFSVNNTLHKTPKLDTLPFYQMPYPVRGQFLAGEASATSASNFEWLLRNLLCADGIVRPAGERSLYDMCSDLISSRLNAPNDIQFMPFLFGGPEGAPAGLLGVQARHKTGDVLRAVFEGVAFSHKTDIGILLSGPDAARPKTARLGGGASKNMVWAQIFADTLGMPVEITDGTELGAQGCAITAAAAAGLHPDIETAIARMVRVVRRFEPNAERTAVLHKKYQKFRDITKALAAAWQPSASAA
ncbi:FGGY-family carbohydrate kinase [soil metagenome]